MDDQERHKRTLVGPIERFDQINEMFKRARFDPEWIDRSQPFYTLDRARDKHGFTHEYHALVNASWYVEDHLAMGIFGSNLEGLYSWESLIPDMEEVGLAKRIDLSSPAEATKKVKRAARFFGASLVGVCELDERWLYSQVVNTKTGDHYPLEFPPDCRYAITMAVEMDYALMQASPTAAAGPATGLGYSKMAFIAGLLAQFIRGLGYKAIPSGNDTALSIPIAVEAGLGELGRNGLLITEDYGPRVRICKVFTDMPLVSDKPRFFGVEEFCRVCMKCAEDCPSQAIPYGEKSTQVPTRSNSPGVHKWTIDPEQCFKFWISNQMECSNCIRVCPFNQEKGWIHDLVRYFVKRAPFLDRLFLRAHDALGYGKQLDPSAIWDQ